MLARAHDLPVAPLANVSGLIFSNLTPSHPRTLSLPPPRARATQKNGAVQPDTRGEGPRVAGGAVRAWVR